MLKNLSEKSMCIRQRTKSQRSRNLYIKPRYQFKGKDVKKSERSTRAINQPWIAETPFEHRYRSSGCNSQIISFDSITGCCLPAIAFNGNSKMFNLTETSLSCSPFTSFIICNVFLFFVWVESCNLIFDIFNELCQIFV